MMSSEHTSRCGRFHRNDVWSTPIHFFINSLVTMYMSEKKRKELMVKIIAVAIVLIFVGTALVAGVSVLIK